MIRNLTVEEVPEVVFLGSLFWEEAKLPGKMIPEKVIESWGKLYQAGIGAIIGYFDTTGKLKGGLGYLLYPDFNDGSIIANEMFWYVDPASRGAGLGLLREYEAQARAAGASRIVMCRTAHLGREPLEKLYLRLGYSEAETLFFKNLT